MDNNTTNQGELKMEELKTAARDMLTAVKFIETPKLFNGALCYDARIPVEFVENLERALNEAHNG